MSQQPPPQNDANLWAPWRMEYIAKLGDELERRSPRRVDDSEAGEQRAEDTPEADQGEVAQAGATSAADLGRADESERGSASAPARCFLCEGADTSPEASEFVERLILVNDERGLMLLNRYPYASGHLLVSPRAHAGTLNDLDKATRDGLFDLVALAERLLQATYNPQGINVGINVGRAAGAGVPGHLHVHLVPRWMGDTNFMSSVGGLRVIPQALDHSYAWLVDAINKLSAR